MRIILSAACVGVLLAGSSALASSSGNWILNGSSVEYAGANQLRIGYGTIYSGGGTGSNYQVTTATVTTSPTPSGMIWASSSTTNCPLSTTSLQGNSTAYYVYYEGSTSQIVATTVAPFENGYPNGSLYTKSGATCTANTGGLYTFLGSFITNSSGNIVPFQRHGERVLLNFDGASNPEASTTFNAAGGANTVTMTGFIYPTTAAALILEVQTQNNDVTNSHTTYIVDTNNGASNNATCATGTLPTGIDWSGYAYSDTVVQERIDYPTNTSGSNTIKISDCDTVWAIGSTSKVNVFYYGYIEPVPYLDQIR